MTHRLSETELESNRPGVRVRTWANIVRGTRDDAPKVRRLLDELAVRDDIPYALYEWCEEVTRLVERL